ncbi:MAG: hypothetical protein O2923_08820 [Verrucomicrobia bacterium]|nr:hypothetical protein [Verrucomicrobiota bacterium]MDA1087364.1 hypothetical protein [Verrucomicrobiota bacterium]
MPGSRSSRRSGLSPAQASLVGLVLLVVCAAGTIYSVCATISQRAYRAAKYGAGKDNLELALKLCRTAEKLYPFNFYVQQYISEKAYYASFDAESHEEAAALLKLSQHWCDRGLRLNYYDRTLRLRRVALLAGEDLVSAVAEMERYLDWHYWHPHNHAIMARLYARAGEFDKAEQSLFLVERSPYYEDAVHGVELAKRKFLESLASP